MLVDEDESVFVRWSSGLVGRLVLAATRTEFGDGVLSECCEIWRFVLGSPNIKAWAADLWRVGLSDCPVSTALVADSRC